MTYQRSTRTHLAHFPKLLPLIFLSVFSAELRAQSRFDPENRDRSSIAASNFGANDGSLWQGWLGGQSQATQWRLGVQGDNTDVGVRVREVAQGSAADRARIETGDVVLNVNGYQVGIVNDRLYDLSEEINRRADASGVVSLLVQDHRNFGLATVRVQLDRRQPLTGVLVYHGRAPMPSDAIVTVKIENVSRPYYQVQQGEIVFRPSTTGEIPFEIAYDPNYINQQDIYRVRAFVTSGGRTILDSPQPQRVITGGSPNQVTLLLASLAGSPVSSSSGFPITAGYSNYNAVDERIRQSYRQYLRRDPTALELAAWRNVPGIEQRLEQIPIDLMAAQEYFDAAGNNNQLWLQRVFQEIVGKPPTAQETQAWMQRYADLRFSRTELLRQLQAQVRR